MFRPMRHVLPWSTSESSQQQKVRPLVNTVEKIPSASVYVRRMMYEIHKTEMLVQSVFPVDG